MPEILAEALRTEGLLWLFIAMVVAGLVRGFSGFGSAMIIMPVASSVLSPLEAIIFLVAAEVLGPLPNLPKAWRDGKPRDIGLLICGALVGLPIGLWLLSLLSPEVFGWAISGIVMVLLALIVTGWRFRGHFTPSLKLGTGWVSGFMTGFSGIPGPPVIMLYMASTLPVQVIRANITMHLLAVDFILFPLLWMLDMMIWKTAVLGFLLGVPYLLANVVGTRLFNPSAERQFRLVAYGIILMSAVLGLPLWQG
jgi:uncharacterized membrane protein YfcA